VVDGDDVQGGALGAEVLEDGAGGAACDVGELREFADRGQPSVPGVMAAGSLPRSVSGWGAPSRPVASR
jgi:hypothetical protein